VTLSWKGNYIYDRYPPLDHPTRRATKKFRPDLIKNSLKKFALPVREAE